jgi:hypothetical protein
LTGSTRRAKRVIRLQNYPKGRIDEKLRIGELLNVPRHMFPGIRSFFRHPKPCSLLSVATLTTFVSETRQ